MTDAQAPIERPKKTGYLRSLDGWRALAVIGVLMAHDRPWNVFGYSSESYKGYGGFGVYLFFAISGFLITTRILEEETIVGRFDIKRFYIRRLLRIQPAALVYLAVVALLMVTAVIQDTWAHWFAALFLYVNFTYRTYDIGSIWTGHFWTLAVEEHFYILLSLVLLFFRKRRTVVLGTWFIAVILPLSLNYGIRRGWGTHAPRSTEWQLSSLVLAALVAAVVRRPRILQFVKRWMRPWVVFAATPLLMEVPIMEGKVHAHEWPRMVLDLRPELTFLATYVFILWIVATVFHPQSWTTRFLELKPLRFVGRISYSLYLWHVMVYDLWHTLLFSGNGSFAHLPAGHLAYSLMERPARIATSFGVAILSYTFIEKPMIRLGHKLAPPATPGRPELADLPVETPLRAELAEASAT